MTRAQAQNLPRMHSGLGPLRNISNDDIKKKKKKKREKNKTQSADDIFQVSASMFWLKHSRMAKPLTMTLDALIIS